MIDLLRNYFGQFSFLANHDLAVLVSATRIQKVSKGEYLVRQGELKQVGFVVLKGLVRTYVLDSRSEEITILLAMEGDTTGAYACILLGEPSTENIQAMEDSLLIVMDISKYDRLFQKNLRFLRLQNTMLKSHLARAAERIHFFSVNSPEERVTKFCEQYPRLLQRVPQKYLASYLGMTTVSFSRIKSRIRDKAQR